MIQTEIFKFGKGRLMGYLLMRYGRGWLGAAFCVALILIIISVILSDLRYVILSLMVIFIAAPMILALVLINHSLDPDVAFNTLPHSIKIENSESILLKIYPKIIEEEEKNGEEDVEKGEDKVVKREGDVEMGDDRVEKGDEESTKIDLSKVIERRVATESMKHYVVASDYVVIPFDKSGLMFLPRDIFP